MTKNKKILVPVLSALATAAVTVPTLATTVSCAKKDKFSGESVLDGLYEPSDIEPYRTSSNLNFAQAESVYFDYISNHLDVPAKEFKWMAAGFPSIVKDFNTYIRTDLFSGQIEYDPITLTKLNVRMSNFTITDADLHKASYQVVQDIELKIHLEVPEEEENELTFRSVTGTIRLAWCNDVTNMPVGLFDLGTDNLHIFNPTSNDLPFPDKVLWYMAPDMSQVSYNDNTWSMNLDYLLDLNIVINEGVQDEDKVIDFNNEFKFTFDKWACFGIEKLFGGKRAEDSLEADLVERLIPLTCGWDSYYLSQSNHADHINGDLEDYGWQTETVDEPEFIDEYEGVYVSPDNPAIYKYALGEPGINENQIGVVPYGITFDSSSLLGFSVQKANIVDVDWEVVDNGASLLVSYDWAMEQRPKAGYTTAELYDFIVPVVMTKDWFALGRGFNLYEKEDNFGSWDPNKPEEIYIPLGTTTDVTMEDIIFFDEPGIPVGAKVDNVSLTCGSDVIFNSGYTEYFKDIQIVSSEIVTPIYSADLKLTHNGFAGEWNNVTLSFDIPDAYNQLRHVKIDGLHINLSNDKI